MKETTLECGWCGDIAFRSSDGYFIEDDGEACESCGFPGHVGLEEDYDSGEEDSPAYIAYWCTHDWNGDIITEWERAHPDKAKEIFGI